MLCNLIHFEAFKILKLSQSVTESVTMAINKKWRKVLRPRVKFGQKSFHLSSNFLSVRKFMPISSCTWSYLYTIVSWRWWAKFLVRILVWTYGRNIVKAVRETKNSFGHLVRRNFQSKSLFSDNLLNWSF